MATAIDASEAAEIAITREMISGAALALVESGSLAEPTIAVAALAERVLRMALHGRPSCSADQEAYWKPSKIALLLDKSL